MEADSQVMFLIQLVVVKPFLTRDKIGLTLNTEHGNKQHATLLGIVLPYRENILSVLQPVRTFLYAVRNN